MEKRLTMILACLFLAIGTALAQTRITGVVTSSEDGNPVVGATVKVEGQKVGAITDLDGRFVLNVADGTKIEVSYIGMTSKTVKAHPNMRITLDPDNKQLDEVMVVAFGTTKRSAFTGSATVVDSDVLSQSQTSSVTNALAGKVPGLQLTSSNGAPGSTSTIRIRGFSSISAGQDPLIILDGAPYEGDIAQINQNDVESINVLKDAASNALYGARGANGVVIITTKRAKMGDAKVTFDAKTGWNSRALQNYDVITDPAAYYEAQYAAVKNYYVSNGYSETEAWMLANQGLTGAASNGGLGYNIWTVPDGQALIGQNGKMNPNATLGRIVSYGGSDYLVTPDDWEEEGMRTGRRQEYNFTVSAANERASFYASLGYLNEEGITYNSDLERLTGRLRADYQAKKWLKVGANLSFSHYNTNQLNDNGSSSSTGNVWALITQIAPIYPIYVRNADGSIKIDDNGLKVYDYGSGQNAGLTRPFINDANPVSDNILNTNNSGGNTATANGYADIEFMPGLKLTLNGTYFLNEYRSTEVYNPYYGQFDSTGGTVGKEHDRVYSYNLQQLLNYNTTIADKHNLSAMIGHEYYNYKTYLLYASKSNMFSQTNKELNGAVVDGQNSQSYQTRYNNEGFFARVMYDYDNRYFFQGSIRRDASSRFHPDHRWGTFWSLGAAWLISKESWFNASWVDELKLKASIGSQGNDNIGNYRYTDTYTVSNSDGEIGVTFNTKGTEDITWETNTNINVGTEFTLFKRLTGSVEFYNRKTSDMLFSYSVAPSLGYSSYYDNIGDMYNRGFEITLNYNIFNKKNFNWDVQFNMATLRNRITMLPEGKKTATYYDLEGNSYTGFASSNFLIAEGVPLYTWRLKEYAGVSEDGESMWYKNVFDEDGNWTGVETTTTYSDADYYVNNESTIPKVYGGFGTSLYVYGFDLSVNFSFSLGGKGYDYTYAQFMAPPTSSNAGYNFHKDIYNSWSAENPNSDIPRWQYQDTYASSYSTRFLTNASYLNIENINFGYTLPSTLTQKFSIETLRLYLACQNVAYISARKGFDPRQTYSDVSNATNYSPMRTVSIGLTLTF